MPSSVYCGIHLVSHLNSRKPHLSSLPPLLKSDLFLNFSQFSFDTYHTTETVLRGLQLLNPSDTFNSDLSWPFCCVDPHHSLFEIFSFSSKDSTCSLFDSFQVFFWLFLFSLLYAHFSAYFIKCWYSPGFCPWFSYAVTGYRLTC